VAAQTKTKQQQQQQQQNNKSHAQIFRKGVKRKAWSVYLALSRRPIKKRRIIIIIIIIIITTIISKQLLKFAACFHMPPIHQADS